MTPGSIFQLCNLAALAGWIILVFLPFRKWTEFFLTGILVTLLSAVYSLLIFQAFQPLDAERFGSLQGVMELFQDPVLVVAGWVHYLAFDLLVGVFIRKDSLKHGISHWVIVVPLLFTFLLGPFGLLLYLLFRLIKTTNFFTPNA